MLSGKRWSTARVVWEYWLEHAYEMDIDHWQSTCLASVSWVQPLHQKKKEKQLEETSRWCVWVGLRC